MLDLNTLKDVIGFSKGTIINVGKTCYGFKEDLDNLLESVTKIEGVVGQLRMSNEYIFQVVQDLEEAQELILACIRIKRRDVYHRYTHSKKLKKMNLKLKSSFKYLMHFINVQTRNHTSEALSAMGKEVDKKMEDFKAELSANLLAKQKTSPRRMMVEDSSYAPGSTSASFQLDSNYELGSTSDNFQLDSNYELGSTSDNFQDRGSASYTFYIPKNEPEQLASGDLNPPLDMDSGALGPLDKDSGPLGPLDKDSGALGPLDNASGAPSPLDKPSGVVIPVDKPSGSLSLLDKPSGADNRESKLVRWIKKKAKKLLGDEEKPKVAKYNTDPALIEERTQRMKSNFLESQKERSECQEKEKKRRENSWYKRNLTA